MKRLLVLAYYVPPLGLSGVQRVTKLAQHLGAHGWACEIVAPTPGAYFARDETLLDDLNAAGVTVHRTRSLDPTRLARAASAPPAPGTASSHTPSTVGGRRHRLLAAATAWAFVPDNKLGWLPFALARAHRLLSAGRFDAVLASAPPYTGLVAGALAARRHGLPLVLDLRDDWLGNPRHVYPTRLHRRLHARLETWTFRQADAILTISEEMRSSVVSRHPALAGRVYVVPQGFDESDFAAPLPARTDDRFRVVYTGVFYDAQRPDVFLDGLARFRAARPEAQADARFVGMVPEGFDALVARHGLSGVVTRVGYLPHAAAVQEQRAADLLWMTVGRRPGAEGISTGKLFEYFGRCRPILGLVPDGTARAALVAYGAAYLADPDDPQAVAKALALAYDDHQRGTAPRPDEAFVRRHGRQALAGDVGRLLDSLVAGTAIAPR